MNKRNRVMEIFYRFMSGEHMAVKDLAAEYEVSEKSIQRDISEIKNFMAEYGYSVGKEESLTVLHRKCILRQKSF